ncbi:cobyrinic acid a,c-diamide synthase [Desulfacinum hydrothermale DSM 13146]|uniref:Cobyrinate a,c-diamide synthase n=1 Tax=Desulfacinum hydrothermale DSM 13146 TaxID=1121390 RepID=A0A1W1XNH9_9BACT|nr:cobyrinate a,c-diamide synthase [Desulfacinum hydrothermale]SMC25422.1 cobyrinic acid a,c-diamide synthase [Desulfacinum hydrothermale DSM 13146]
MNQWAFAVAAPQSGSGKTTVTLALLAALRRRGLRVQPFKVGPDFIDPGFHTAVTGRVSRNLDGWMLSRDYNVSLFDRLTAEADGAVVEGVMGLFDGYDGASEAGSTAQMAKWLQLPVLLVVDARSMARSAAALVHGFASFDADLRLAGVVFNRVGSPAHLGFLKEALESSCPQVPVFGGIPKDASLNLPERHLGLVTVEELLLEQGFLDRLARLAEDHLDLDRLLEAGTRPLGPALAQDRGVLVAGREKGQASHEPARRADSDPVVVAVARDAAFCFYYQDNLDLLEAAGARLRFFSPLAGESVPEDAQAVYLGGGYPEVHAARLSENRAFFQDLGRLASQGRPIYAECGGLMALSRSVQLVSGDVFPMAGLLPFRTRMLRRRKALGYVEVVLAENTLLGPRGTRLRGHEFHYSEIVDEDGRFPCRLVYRLTGRKFRSERPEGYRVGSVLASYVHLHWGSCPEVARAFVESARRGRG